MTGPPAAPDRLGELRRRLEHLDGQLVALVAERVRTARDIGDLKRAAGQPSLDPAREAAVVRRAAELALEHGLPGEPVRAFFWQLIGLCRRAQER
jgi:chorismate mutase